MPLLFKSAPPQLTFSQLVPFFLLPAEIGLLTQIATVPSTAQKILAIALALFCPELTRMAWVDLRDATAVENRVKETVSESAKPPEEVAHVQKETPPERKLAGQTKDRIATQTKPQTDKQITRFRRVVISTIVLEATGFYLAWRSLPVGAIVIIFSQLWFNLLAGVQIHPAAQPPVVPFPLSRRKAVLVANAIALSLLCLWPISAIRQIIAIGLLTLISIFLIVKYGFSHPAQN